MRLIPEGTFTRVELWSAGWAAATMLLGWASGMLMAFYVTGNGPTWFCVVASILPAVSGWCAGNINKRPNK